VGFQSSEGKISYPKTYPYRLFTPYLADVWRTGAGVPSPTARAIVADEGPIGRSKSRHIQAAEDGKRRGQRSSAGESRAVRFKLFMGNIEKACLLACVEGVFTSRALALPCDCKSSAAIRI